MLARKSALRPPSTRLPLDQVEAANGNNHLAVFNEAESSSRRRKNSVTLDQAPKWEKRVDKRRLSGRF